GKARLFATAEISREVLLASTCLPHLRQAVRIGDRHYWDGGYSANPPVLMFCPSRKLPVVSVCTGASFGVVETAVDIGFQILTLLAAAVLAGLGIICGLFVRHRIVIGTRHLLG
ncbi:MAG: hypothetical protein HC844_07655, partial [Tabrizicola sp.]|nr:hypothetical protein [Tabrizicola sp.]